MKIAYKLITIFVYRWLTTASGYLWLLIFHYDSLTMIQKDNVLRVASFILSIYAPMCLRIHFSPRGPEGPGNILFCRDLLLAFLPFDEELINDAVKAHFIRHAKTWLGGQNLALSTYAEYCPYCLDDLRNPNQTLPSTIPIETMLWERTPIKSFFTKDIKKALCLSKGSKEFWQSKDCHNRTCERFNGYLGSIFKRSSIKDFESSDKRPEVDKKFRGYMLHQIKQ